ncbi:hypothetical protein A6U97_02555 [Agrobacterium tumefaciens]|uniref:hypothetical protein n=1 Tax=Agrobacterium tumefaciens TaxID=358 RepID=UPI00080FC275|nr:hypothetical protein A6U97_02555 [Agrobacterium tumefaciens]
MARPKLGDTDTERMQLKITAAEIEAIDDWRFENRIPSRSEAVRRLCQIGVLTAKAESAMRKHSTLSMAEMVLFLGDISKICTKYADEKVTLELKLAVEKHGKKAMLNSAQAMTEVGELTNHVSYLAKNTAVEDSMEIVAKNILRKGEADLLTLQFVKEAIEDFK